MLWIWHIWHVNPICFQQQDRILRVKCFEVLWAGSGIVRCKIFEKIDPEMPLITNIWQTWHIDPGSLYGCHQKNSQGHFTCQICLSDNCLFSGNVEGHLSIPAPKNHPSGTSSHWFFPCPKADVTGRQKSSAVNGIRSGIIVFQTWHLTDLTHKS